MVRGRVVEAVRGRVVEALSESEEEAVRGRVGEAVELSLAAQLSRRGASPAKPV